MCFALFAEQIPVQYLLYVVLSIQVHNFNAGEVFQLKGYDVVIHKLSVCVNVWKKEKLHLNRIV
jgi:hypothetical protein